MYQFTKAPVLTKGSVITAKHIAKVSAALNDRIRSGIADGSRRISAYVMNSMRNFRNPADEFTFPSQLEHLTFFNHVEPELSELYPITERGEPEGLNLANPISAYVAGNPQLYGDGDKISILIPLNPNETVADKWELGMQQRGGISLDNNVQYTPFYSCSQYHFQIVSYPFQFYQKTMGSYLPSARVIEPTCTDSETDPTIAFPNREYKWKRLSDGFTVTYSGICGPLYNGTDTDIAFIEDTIFFWKVHLYNGTIDTYNKSEWIILLEGGGTLQKDNADFINRMMLNQYAGQFRGSQTYGELNIFPNESPFPVTSSAIPCPTLSQSFDFQDVVYRPWQLSPAYGIVVSGDLHITGYPSASLTASCPTGTTFGSPFPYSIHDKFCMGGLYWKGIDLVKDTKVNVYSNGKLVKSFTALSGSNEDCFTINKVVSGSISIKVMNDLELLSGSAEASLYCQISELLLKYPEAWDLATYLRASSALADINVDTEFDRLAVNEGQAREIWENYNHYGCIVNLQDADEVSENTIPINTNSEYESLREYIHSFSRYIKKEQLLAYEVSASKSILYFNKYHDDDGEINMWNGMLDHYNTGSNGIKAVAPTGSWSAEFVMDVGMKPTNRSESSIWKDDAYYWWGIDRALFLNSIVPNNYPDIYQFKTDGAGLNPLPGNLILTNPEYGCTYNAYDRGINSGGPTPPTLPYYLSNPIYPEPDELESITCTGNIVKLVFKKRFQHCTGAAETISTDVSQWDRDIGTWNTETQTWDTTGEIWGNNFKYRTLENSILDYLYAEKDLDTNAIPFRIGDCAARNVRDFFTDQSNGFVAETFCFLRLAPVPFSGSGCDNKTILSSNYLQLAETYIRCMAEGYIDSYTPFSCSYLNDATSNAFDFTYANLAASAFNGNHITYNDRPDNGISYGTLTNTKPYVSTINQISKCLNEMTRARLPLPFQIQIKNCSYLDSGSYGATFINGESCGGSFVSAFNLGFSGPGATTLVSCDEDWQDVFPDIGGNIAFGATTGMGWSGNCSEDGTQFIISTQRNTVQYRLILTDPLSINAISPKLYENFSEGSPGFFGELETFTERWQARTINSCETSFQTCLCSGTEPTCVFYNGNTGFGLDADLIQSDVFECAIFTSGLLDEGSSAGSTDLLMCKVLGCSPPASSGTGAVKSQAIRVSNTNTSIIVVPLID